MNSDTESEYCLFPEIRGEITVSLGNGVENGLGEVAHGGGATPGRGEASSGASWAPGLRRYLGVGVRCTSTEPQQPFTLRGTMWGSIRVPPSSRLITKG